MSVKKALLELKLPTQLDKLTEKHFKQLILFWIKEKGLSPTTINHRRMAMLRLCQYLQAEGVIDNNPVSKIDKLKTTKFIVKPFSDDQLKSILSQPDTSTFVGFRDLTIMLVLLDTGVRLIEMERMKTTEVNLKDKKILILGKGSKEREVFFENRTKDYLYRYITIRGELDHNYLWISNDSKKEYGKSFVIHKNRGRKPSHALTDEVRNLVVNHKKSEKYSKANFSHFQELLEEHESISLSKPSVYRILLVANRFTSPRKHSKVKHNKRRKRKPQRGMMVIIDASPHAWFFNNDECALHDGYHCE